MLSPRDMLNLGLGPGKPSIPIPLTPGGQDAPHPVSQTEQKRGALDKGLAEYVAMLRRGGNGHGGEFDPAQMGAAVKSGDSLYAQQAALEKEEAANKAMLAIKALAGSAGRDATAVRSPSGR